jgi:hypothetical protein
MMEKFAIGNKYSKQFNYFSAVYCKRDPRLDMSGAARGEGESFDAIRGQ